MTKYTINLGSLGTRSVRASDLEDVDLDEDVIIVDGQRFSEDAAALLAREIGRRHGLRGGRPALPAQERASVQKAVRLTPDKAERLASAARARGVRESELIRDAIDAYLEAS